MSLTIFKRDVSGKIMTDDNGRDRYEQLPLKGEMDIEDFAVPSSMLGQVSLSHAWLHANFSQGVLWVPESQDFDDFKKEMADFLNSNMTGPYFVHEGFVNTRWTLDIVLLDPSDIKTFATQYPDWQQKSDAVQRNSETLSKWKDTGRKLQNSGMYNYAGLK